MASLTDRDIEAIARRIVADLRDDGRGALEGTARAGAQSGPDAPGAMGVYTTVDEAVAAARAAQPVFARLPLKTRARVIAAIRDSMLQHAAALARAAHAETGLGRVEDKVVKNLLVTEKTPGLEDLAPEAVTGDHGLSLVEPAPFGVIGAITPITNPTSTIICNAIGMLAAGNAVVFNVHPGARECSIQTVALINRAIESAGGPRNVVTCLANPTIESAQETMRHRHVRLVVVTGGGAVVKAAMSSGKRAILCRTGQPARRRGRDGPPRQGRPRHRPRRVHRQQHHLHGREGSAGGRVGRRPAAGGDDEGRGGAGGAATGCRNWRPCCSRRTGGRGATAPSTAT